jgi:hypothetical protein
MHWGAALQMDAEKRAHKVEEYDKMTGRSTGHRLGDVCQHITYIVYMGSMYIPPLAPRLQGKDSPPKKSPAPSRLRNDSMCGRQKSSTCGKLLPRLFSRAVDLYQIHAVNHAQ